MVIATTLLPAIALCFILVPQGQHKAGYKVLLLKELWNCFLKRKKSSGSVVVDDAYHSTKLCGLQSKRFALPADQYPGPALVWLPPYPTCGSVVVYEAQRSVSHNQNYKFNCSPFQNLPPLVPLHHVTWVMSTFFFFFFNFLKSCPTHSTCPPRGCARQRWSLLREGKEEWLTVPDATNGLAELVQLCLFCCLWFLELLIILIEISLLLIQ